MNTEELKIEIENLKRSIEELSQKFDSLTNYNTIPFDVQEAFTLRLPVPNVTGTSTADTQTIALTGNPQNITVPAQPSGTLTVISNGVTYQLLYK